MPNRSPATVRDRRGRVGLPFGRTGVSLAAVVASFGVVAVLCRLCGAQTQPAIVAAFVALSLSRRPSPASRAHALTVPAGLAGVALGAAGTGLLLHTVPPLGAVVFIAGMSCSVWLRNFGGLARNAGALIAMPLAAMLVVPPPSVIAGQYVPDLVPLVCAGPVALLCVAAAQAIAERAGIVLFAPSHPLNRASSPAARSGLTPQTRMALQMAVALAAAFAVGFTLFPAHWGWTVLTTFIVCSGTRGRGDTAYKSVLRLIGAVAGTLGAAAIVHVRPPAGVFEGTAIFVVLYVGLLLRDVSYAYWACCMTLIFALLAPANGSGPGALLELRLEAILAGAVCAVAATWFVLPIRTEAVIRRRLADALRALDDLVAHPWQDDHATRLATFEHRIAELDLVAPPVFWHRRIFRIAQTAEHPAHWIDLAGEIGCHTRVLCAGHGFDRGAVRRAVGAARRALAAHGNPASPVEGLPVSASLRMLRDAVVATSERGADPTGGSKTPIEVDGSP